MELFQQSQQETNPPSPVYRMGLFDFLFQYQAIATGAFIFFAMMMAASCSGRNIPRFFANLANPSTMFNQPAIDADGFLSRSDDVPVRSVVVGAIFTIAAFCVWIFLAAGSGVLAIIRSLWIDFRKSGPSFRKACSGPPIIGKDD